MRLRLSIVFLLISLLAGAQIQNSLFKNYTVSDGLLDEKIHCVFQDSKGWIWIGSDYGIMRFDGYTFFAFNLESPESDILSNTLIRCITEDSKGNIWIATEFQGIFKYTRSEYKLEQFKNNGLSHNSVWDIKEDKNGKLWVATEYGLNVFNPQTNQVEKVMTAQTESGLSDNWIRKLHFDTEHNLWIGTNKGVTRLSADGNKFTSYLNHTPKIDRENEVWEIFQDRDGKIWIGTYLGGVKLFDNKTQTFVDFSIDKDINRSKTVRSIVQDLNGDLWFGTRGGLYQMKSASKTIIHYQNETNNSFSLSHNSVLNLWVDKKGDLWIGTRNGLSYLNFDKLAFGYLTVNESTNDQLNNSEIYVLYEDEDGNLWIGTESGGVNIFNFQTDSFSYLTSAQGLSNNCIKAICPDNRGNILIGTYLSGLNQYNPQTRKNTIYKANPANPSSLSDNEVWTIYKDSKNRIWVGTTKGLDLFDDATGTFTHFGPRYNLGSVGMVFEDASGNFWAYSTDTEKLTLIYPDQTYKVFDIECRAMCDAETGFVWLATLGSGLLHFNLATGQFTSYTTQNGLCSNVLYGILKADNGELWLSTNSGIAMFDPATKTFTNYFNSDGLLNNKFNYGAFYKMSDNSMVFGGKKGIDFIFTNKLKKNTLVPSVMITAFRLFNKPVGISNHSDSAATLQNFIFETPQITLSYKQNMLAFDFAALNYANSYKNRYKYKLEGFDNDWNDIGTLRTATYTNLKHGEYVFRVIGSNNDMVFNTQGATLNIIIRPPFWQTWWFRIMAFILLLAVLAFIFIVMRNREKLKQQLIFERQTARKLNELDRLKHQFFMNISHEIRTPLSLIVGPVNKLMESEMNPEQVKSNLLIIQRNTNSLSNLVNQLLDYRKLETGNLKLELSKGNMRVLVSELVETFMFQAQEKQIKLDFKAYQRTLISWFDTDKVTKIVNNLVSNAIKYTPQGGTIAVDLSLVAADDMPDAQNLIPPFDASNTVYNRFIKIKVSDTGIGIAPNELSIIFNRFKRLESNDENHPQGTGIGLALTKELVLLHNGHIRVKSTLGKGSQFSVFLPFDDSNIAENKVITIPDEVETNAVGKFKDSKKHIALIVDDNPDIREFIKSNFEPEYQVVEARNGKEAWESALELIPDIIVADVMMPIMNGNELCKKIKRDERTSHIPVLMLSALGSNENQLAGIDAGADDYMTKPFDVGLLKAKVDNLLSIRKALRDRYSKELLLKPKDVVVASPDEKFIKRLIGFIEKNISNEELDVDQMAQHLDVSRTQLYRKIAALTNMTPKEFVRDIRLKTAEQLIMQGTMNVSEIAYYIGFSDVAYFRKCFKEKYGMSASDYKKQKG